MKSMFIILKGAQLQTLLGRAKILGTNVVCYVYRLIHIVNYRI